MTLNDIITGASNSMPAAAFTGLGAVLTTLFTALRNRRNDRAQERKNDLDSINVATSQLVNGLLAQVKALQEEVAALRLANQKCQEGHDAAQKEIDVLRMELRVTRQQIGLQPVAPVPSRDGGV